MVGRKILATFVFEFSRSLTKSRIATSLVLVLFAPVMLMLFGITIQVDELRRQIPFPLPILGVFHLLAIFLSALLWATPVVYSELEGKTWSYLAIRPQGKLASTLGKFLNAVFWASATGVLSLTLSCIVISQFPWDPGILLRPDVSHDPSYVQWVESLDYSSHPMVVWYSLFFSVVLGSLALSAIFVHIGLLTHKRGMVFAVIYAIVETVFAFLPAVVRQFSIGFHLRNIAFKVGQFNPLSDTDLLVDGSAIWFHVVVLLAITVVHLGASIYWLHSREYITVEEA